MTKFLLLGGTGATGRSLVRHLLMQTDADVVLASRSLQKAQALAETFNAEFKTRRVTAVRAEANDAASLKTAFPGTSMVLVAAPTTHQAGTVIRSALEAGADYLDVQISAEKFALLQSLAPEIEKAGRCFITEAGFHPGLPSALVRYAATQLDSIESAVIGGYLNMGNSHLPFTESVDELMEAFRDYQAQVLKDGQWTKPSSFAMRKINFGGDIGTRNAYSMFFEELGPLPQMYPSLKELGFYMSETHWFLDWFINMIVFAGIKLFPKRGIRPLGKLVWWGMTTLPKPPYRLELHTEATGLKNGRQTGVVFKVSHEDGYELTAIPVVAALKQYLDGSTRKPGVWMMGHLVDPVRLINDMERMGVTINNGPVSLKETGP
jgi:saccharopine dehydrogenase (NAD+, L-lysine-forming)